MTPTTPAKHGDPHLRDLLEEGAQLAIHDPKVETAQIARDLHQANAVPIQTPAPPGLLLAARAPGNADDVASAMAGADAV